MPDHLIACVLGGTARGARTELHDVAFTVGSSLDAVHEQLLDAWFGDPRGLHVDAWMFLDSVAGYRVTVAREPATNALRLYFVNLGAYALGEFGERHAMGFLAGTSRAEAKAHAKATMLQGLASIHKDYLYAVDECLPVAQVGDWYVHLEPDPNAKPSPVTSGYFPLPAAVVHAWLARHPYA